MPKTNDGGFLLDDSELNPYAVDESDSDDDLSDGNKNVKGDKAK